MKQIKIKYVDFWSAFDSKNNFITDLLKKHYEVVLSDEPDYLICSCFGYEFLKYDCVKIQFIFENVTPNFSLYDYVIGFDWIDYEDRYLRYPLYAVSNYAKMLQLAITKHERVKEDACKRKFCNFVVSNADNRQNCRENFFDLLSTYKKVDSGGRFRNNVGGPVKDKLEFQEQYKFSIAFENTESNGYTTEKLVEAWAAGTVPIYWGNPLVGKDFNKKAMICCYDYPDLEAVANEVKRIDSDEQAYNAMLREPILLDESKANEYLDYALLDEFFCSIMNQPLAKVKRRNSRRIEFEITEKAVRDYYRFQVSPKLVCKKLMPSKLLYKIKAKKKIG